MIYKNGCERETAQEDGPEYPLHQVTVYNVIL